MPGLDSLSVDQSDLLLCGNWEDLLVYETSHLSYRVSFLPALHRQDRVHGVSSVSGPSLSAITNCA